MPDPTDTPDEESFPSLEDLQARGIWITGDQLAPPRRARSGRARDGKAIVTDGPCAETKEAVGGFDILECGSLEEAVEIAAGHPIARTGTIEVRPLWGADARQSMTGLAMAGGSRPARSQPAPAAASGTPTTITTRGITGTRPR
jgi:hypothetical protein